MRAVRVNQSSDVKTKPKPKNIAEKCSTAELVINICGFVIMKPKGRLIILIREREREKKK